MNYQLAYHVVVSSLYLNIEFESYFVPETGVARRIEFKLFSQFCFRSCDGCLLSII